MKKHDQIHEFDELTTDDDRVVNEALWQISDWIESEHVHLRWHLWIFYCNCMFVVISIRTSQRCFHEKIDFTSISCIRWRPLMQLNLISSFKHSTMIKVNAFEQSSIALISWHVRCFTLTHMVAQVNFIYYTFSKFSLHLVYFRNIKYAGKTHLLNVLIDYCRLHDIGCIVTATTGIAANSLHLGIFLRI